VAIEPDTTNRTWVIGSACPDCGFDGSGSTVATLMVSSAHDPAHHLWDVRHPR
jgi:hypothetical protein